MNTEKKELQRKIKGDIFFFAFSLTIILFSFLIPRMKDGSHKHREAVIIRNGEEIGRYSLNEDNTVTIREESGGYNLILISNGSVRVTDADCPDKLCIRQKDINRSGESIICLPHKLVITIESPEESDLDAVTN